MSEHDDLDKSHDPQDLGDLLRRQLGPDDVQGLAQIITSSQRSPEGRAARNQSSHYEELINSLLPKVTRQRQRFEQERQELPELLRELMQHPAERRFVLVANSARFRSWALCDLLVGRSAEECSRNPAEAVELAELAVEVSRQLAPEDHSPAILNDLRARALCQLANARTAAGYRPQAVEEALSEAEALLLQGTGDLMELARLRSLQGSLRGDQRRFDESFELFDRALAIYRRCGEDHMVGRTLIKKALFFGFAFQPEKAIDTLKEGLRLVDPRREPRLILAANHNLIFNLNDCGRHQEAEELLEISRPLYEEIGGRIDRLRLRWLEARLARERGDLDEAEEAFRKTREAFLQEGIGWDVALVSLELAAVYAQQGRVAEIKTLAAELVPVFRANDLRREAVAALILFQKAAQMEKISLSLIRSTMSQLRGLRQDR